MNTIYSYMRSRKAAAMQRIKSSNFEKVENLSANNYENATILPLKRVLGDDLLFGRGGVVDTNGNYIESSGIYRRVGGFYAHSPSKTEDLSVVYCGYWTKQWGHFLVESVARLWYALEESTPVDKYVFISEENGPTEFYANYAEFIRLFGLNDKIEVINQPTRYRNVIVPDLAYSRNHYYSERFSAIFDHIARSAMRELPPSKNYPEKIYFSRSQFKKATAAEFGLDLLDNFFENNGFTILFPEKLTLSEMIGYIRHAQICAAESGTVPHNMLFADFSQKAVIIERQTVINEIQAQIDIIRNLHVTYVDAHYTVFPVYAGCGPYLFTYNKQFQAFSHDCGYSAPDKSLISEKAVKRRLSQYIKVYKKYYGYTWGLEDWQLIYSDAIYEAYLDTLSDLRPYLFRTKPFALLHYLQPHYIKQYIKNIIIKNR